MQTMSKQPSGMTRPSSRFTKQTTRLGPFNRSRQSAGLDANMAYHSTWMQSNHSVKFPCISRTWKSLFFQHRRTRSMARKGWDFFLQPIKNQSCRSCTEDRKKTASGHQQKMFRRSLASERQSRYAEKS